MVKGKSRRRGRRMVFAEKLKAKRKRKEAMGTSSMEDRMIENHRDILQNIEFALLQCYRENNKIDDAAIADALQCAILSQQPNSKQTENIVEALTEMRQVREDISDELWLDGMRTVLRSVDRHSNLKAGKRDYIDFASQFI